MLKVKMKGKIEMNQRQLWVKYLVRKASDSKYTKQPVLHEWGHSPYNVIASRQPQMIDDGGQSDIWLMTKRRLSMGARFQHAVSFRVYIFEGLFSYPWLSH